MVQVPNENDDSEMPEDVSDGWGDPEWPEDDVDGAANNTYIPDDIEFPTTNEKGYKIVPSGMVSKQVVVRIKELEELYSLDLDPLIIIAQHYKWNPDRMQEWLMDENQDRLKY